MDMPGDSPRNMIRKRVICEIDDIDVEDNDSKHTKLDCDDQNKKQNHSEIEKRRRDKMNTYITELSSMVPMCNAMSRKLDKLTVLRMAVQHMKTLRGSINSYTEGHYKPSFLSDEELKHLILQAADGFLFVVSCDRGRILFVSESVSRILNYSQGDLLGKSWFDILHPKDIAKVKEQLSSSDLAPKERLIDAKTMLPIRNDLPQNQTKLCPGARRSFFCRMKCKALPSVKEEADTTTGVHKRKNSHTLDHKFCVIHCTGYLKSWATANLNFDEENEGDEGCDLSCLVAVGQAQQNLLCIAQPSHEIKLRPMEFTSRHAMDGRFLFVDQRATLILGYLPQELLGTSCYEYFHQHDIMHLAESHRQVLQANERITTQVYRFRTKEGNFTLLQSKWKNFCNPWTKEFEYIISVNFLVPVPDVGIVESSNSTDDILSSNSNSLDTVLSYLPSGGNVREAHRFMGTRVGAVKIGEQIADEVTEMLKLQDTSSSSSPAPICNTYGVPSQAHIVNPRGNTSKAFSISSNFNLQGDSPNCSVVNDDFNCSSPQSNQNSNQFNTYHSTPISSENEEFNLMDSLMGRDMMQASYQNNSNEGNDEAAMAVIMSLLEADAGLGGPVDFSGLPWPLP